MDTSQAVTHIGLCAGYGGIELGLKRAVPGLRSIALCEIEAFAISNLVAKMEAGLMDPAPIWPDLKTFPWAAFRDRVDILTGGYPCQPFSAAGQRRGKDDPRHLWPYIADGIRLLRPRCCFFENVEGHISLGLSDVIEDLAGMGYRTTWGIFSASECGAPHQRKRVFILAYKLGTGLEGLLHDAATERRQDAGGSFAGCCQSRGEAWPSRPRELADAQLHGCNHAEQRPHSDGIQGPLGQEHEHGQTLGDGQLWPSRPGEQQYGWEPPRVVSGRQTLDDTQERCLRDDSDNQRQTVGESDTSNDPGSCSGEAMADSHRIDRSAQTEGREHDRQTGPAGEELGDTGCKRQEEQQLPSDWSEQSDSRQTKPPLGGDADGSASGLDYAELCVTCDNRTDELRLLGNGVVPATAERAFRVLIKELL